MSFSGNEMLQAKFNITTETETGYGISLVMAGGNVCVCVHFIHTYMMKLYAHV